MSNWLMSTALGISVRVVLEGLDYEDFSLMNGLAINIFKVCINYWNMMGLDWRKVSEYVLGGWCLSLASCYCVALLPACHLDRKKPCLPDASATVMFCPRTLHQTTSVLIPQKLTKVNLSSKNTNLCQAWWPVIQALGETGRQIYEFEANLVHIVSTRPAKVT